MTKKAKANILCVRLTISADLTCCASIAAALYVDPTSRPWSGSITFNISRAQFVRPFSVRKTAITNMKGRSTVITTTQHNLHNGATDAEPRY